MTVRQAFGFFIFAAPALIYALSLAAPSALWLFVVVVPIILLCFIPVVFPVFRNFFCVQ